MDAINIAIATAVLILKFSLGAWLSIMSPQFVATKKSRPQCFWHREMSPSRMQITE